MRLWSSSEGHALIQDVLLFFIAKLTAFEQLKC
jgi:hypothetical protein